MDFKIVRIAKITREVVGAYISSQSFRSGSVSNTLFRHKRTATTKLTTNGRYTQCIQLFSGRLNVGMLKVSGVPLFRRRQTESERNLYGRGYSEMRLKQKENQCSSN